MNERILKSALLYKVKNFDDCKLKLNACRARVRELREQRYFLIKKIQSLQILLGQPEDEYIWEEETFEPKDPKRRNV